MSDTSQDVDDPFSFESRLDEIARIQDANHKLLATLQRRTNELRGATGGTTETASAASHAQDLLNAAEHLRLRRIADAGVASAEQLIEAWPDPPNELDSVAEMFPNLDPSVVAGLDAADPSRIGAFMLYRGFLGEQLVDDLLASGSLPLPEGTEGYTFADTTNQPGWDLLIETGDATVPAQVKIGKSGSLITDHFSDHPDTIVYASSDAALEADGAIVDGRVVEVVASGDPWPIDSDALIVVDIGISSIDVGEQLESLLGGYEASSIGEQVIEDLPLAAIGIIGLSALRQWATTDTATKDIADGARHRLTQLGINAAAGQAVGFMTGQEFVKAPATFATAVVRSVVSSQRSEIRRSVQGTQAATRHLNRLNKTTDPDPQ